MCIFILISLTYVSFSIHSHILRFDSHLEERMKTPVYNKVNKEKVDLPR